MFQGQDEAVWSRSVRIQRMYEVISALSQLPNSSISEFSGAQSIGVTYTVRMIL